MAGPNAQLEAAFARFAAQPGVAAQAVAQLRSAACVDAERLDQLNRQASGGLLTGFALEAPGRAQSLVGTYDKTSGVVTVPSSGFQPGSTTAGRDLQAVLGLQAIIVEFAHRTWQDPRGQQHTVSQDMVDNLQSTLNASPVLAKSAECPPGAAAYCIFVSDFPCAATRASRKHER